MASALMNGIGVMSLINDAGQTGLEVESLRYAREWRADDLKHREEVNELKRRRVDNARRSVDEKAAQLKSLSHLSALIAGFSLVTMVEATIPDDANHALVTLFAAASSITVRLSFVAFTNEDSRRPPPSPNTHLTSPMHPLYLCFSCCAQPQPCCVVVRSVSCSLR